MFNGKSWKTTLGGIGSIISAIALIISMITGDTPLDLPHISTAGGLVTGGIALLHAKDNNVHTDTDGKNITIQK